MSDELCGSCLGVLRDQVLVAGSNLGLQRAAIREDSGIVHPGQIRREISVVPETGGVLPAEIGIAVSEQKIACSAPWLEGGGTSA